MEPIVIAGGCYFETCEAPYWQALYGSGGRAAQALISRCPVNFYTYFPKARAGELNSFVAAGIDVRAADSSSALAFAYFHPLSDPILAPARCDISRERPIIAEGEAVLRFGFVEGEAVVHGRRVVYDPQNISAFEPFGQNGSTARELAVVLNAQELRAASGQDDLEKAALDVLDSGAEVVVVKSGIQGATVYSRFRSSTWIPAFWSDSVFKIGTGDVFSAAFTYAWAHQCRDPVEAAYAASLSVSQYAGSRSLQQHSSLYDPIPYRAIGAGGGGLVYVLGSTSRLADRWLFEEAIWRLQQLGMPAFRLEYPWGILPGEGTFLILADQLQFADINDLVTNVDVGRTVVLNETGENCLSGMLSTDDFTTALYWVCWTSLLRSAKDEGRQTDLSKLERHG